MAAVTITARDLGEIARMIAPHAADEMTPALNAVRLKTRGNYLTATASDRYTIGSLRLTPAESAGEVDALLRVGAIRALAAQFKGTRRMNPSVTFAASSGVATVTVEGLFDYSTAVVTVPLVDVEMGVHDKIWALLIAPPSQSAPSLGDVAMNPALLARFKPAQRFSEPMVLRAFGRGAAWGVAIGDHFRGAVMPVQMREWPADAWADIAAPAEVAA